MNSWIIYDDMTSERLDFSTDASLRRYCRQKGAKQGWRKLNDEDSRYTGMLVCVYPRNSKLLEILKEGEDIISGLEAEADNAGLDLVEVRSWWKKARQIIEDGGE